MKALRKLWMHNSHSKCQKSNTHITQTLLQKQGRKKLGPVSFFLEYFLYFHVKLKMIIVLIEDFASHIGTTLPNPLLSK